MEKASGKIGILANLSSRYQAQKYSVPRYFRRGNIRWIDLEVDYDLDVLLVDLQTCIHACTLGDY